MRTGSWTLALVALGVAGCSSTDAPTATEELSVAVRQGGVAAHGAHNFSTHLEGDQEVPPVETQAQGQVTLKLSKDGSSLSYRLNVANIEDVLMAHLHLAPRGENGPIVVWLYPDAPPAVLIPGRSSGTLATGTITADDLVGPLEGMSLDALVQAIRDGLVYANVHTSANQPGEIRGQLP